MNWRKLEKNAVEVVVAMEYDMNRELSMLSVRPQGEASAGVDSPGRLPEHAVEAFVGPDACYGEKAQKDAPDLDELLALAARQDRQRLENTLDSMQERCLDVMYDLLATSGVDLRERLVIAVDAEGRLHVGEHPQAELIERILSQNPELAGELRAMAALSLAMRGAEDLALAGKMLRGQSRGRQLLFQACLKGGLSHFHLLGNAQ